MPSERYFSGNLIQQSPSGRPFLYDVTFHQSNTPKPIIVFCHGFKGFKDWGHFSLISDFLAREGFVVVKMNFAYNGTTPEAPLDFEDLEAFGNNNFSKELLDIQSLLAQIRSDEFFAPREELDLESIHIIGHSKGGATALLAAIEEDALKSVATLAAVTQLKARYAEKDIEAWKTAGVMMVYNGRTDQNMPLYFQLAEDILRQEDRFDIIERLKSLNKPALLIHGSGDEAVPISEMEATIGINPKVKQLRLEHANHTFGGQHPYNEKELPADTLAALIQISKFFKEEL